MRIMPSLLLGLSLTACTNLSPQKLVLPENKAAQALADLERWYSNVVEDCEGPDKPAHLCSGIMLRAVETVPAFLSWDPSPRAQELGGISFSWIRRDMNFSDTFGNRNGMIFYPEGLVPEGLQQDIHLRCTFPVDAYTHLRPEYNGCGRRPTAEALTRTCQEQGIHTAQQWLQTYPEVQIGLANVCGWRMEQTPDATAPAFMASVKAHNQLTRYWFIYNELVLSTWQPGQGSTLPIHSFYIPNGSLLGRNRAKYDQIRFYDNHQRIVPIVRIQFPTTQSELATFSYRESDQAYSPTAEHVHADFQDVPTPVPRQFQSRGLDLEHNLGQTLEVLDTPTGSEHFEGKYLAFEGTVLIPVDGIGKRSVTLSWACGSMCAVRESIGSATTSLRDDPEGTEMAFGTRTIEVQAPEVLEVLNHSEQLMLLDNVVIR